MANVSRVNGLRPHSYANGAKFNGAVTEYFIPSTNAVNTFIGDVVVADSTGDTAAAGGLGKGVRSVVPQTAASGAGDVRYVGVIVGFKVDPTNLNTQYRAASTGRYVLVADDPAIIFEVQEDAVGGALAVADVGLNADIIVAAGNTTTGTSGLQLDTSTKAVTATLPLRIVGFSQRQDNEPGVANAKVLVKINTHASDSTVAGV